MPKLCCYFFSPNIVQFQNGSNKVAIELRVVQFLSEIILVISNHTYDFRPNCTPVSSITIINSQNTTIANLTRLCQSLVKFCWECLNVQPQEQERGWYGMEQFSKRIGRSLIELLTLKSSIFKTCFSLWSPLPT